MNAKFVSEAIRPVTSSADTGAMVSGGPGLPAEFVWREDTLRVAGVVRAWKESGPCSHGSGEAYIRKHWFEVETERHGRAKLYFERQARQPHSAKRWWLFSIEDPD